MSGEESALRRWRSRLVATCVTGVVTLVLLEVAGRLVDPIGISYYPETARWLDTMVVKDPVGYWNRPNHAGRYFGAEVRINSLGLRGAEVPPKEEGEFRILLTGDSFPFGIGVGDDATLPAALEARLNASAPQGRRFRVINMGVVSYNTQQELRQLEELGLSLKPDLVLLAFAVNDIEPVMWVFEKRKGFVIDRAQRSYAISLLAFVARNVKFKLFGFSGIALGEFREDSPRWQEVDRALAAMHARCREAGVAFSVFTYDDLVGPKELVQGVGRREGFAVLNLDPPMHELLAGRDPQELRNSIVDSHPNVEGNRAWAEVLEATARKAGLLP